MTSRLDRLGRAAARHPYRTIVLWVLVAIALVVAGGAAGGEFNDNYKIPGVQSQAAIDRLKADFPAAAGSTSNQIVFHARTGALAAPQAQAAIAAPHADAVASAMRFPPPYVGWWWQRRWQEARSDQSCSSYSRTRDSQRRTFTIPPISQAGRPLLEHWSLGCSRLN